MFKYEFRENEESHSIGKYSSIFSIGAKEEMQLICKWDQFHFKITCNDRAHFILIFME